MNTISILPESDDESPATFRAFTKDLGATGRTPGEALDAITLLIGAGKTGAAVLVQPFRPDAHFPAEQRERLSALMERWRAARAAGDSLPAADEAELERLVDAQLDGATARASEMASHLEAMGTPRP